MLKRNDGYTLMDALTGLTILTILSMSILPIYTYLYEERIHITHRTEILSILDEVWSDLVLYDVLPPQQLENGMNIYLIHQYQEKICVSSKVKDQREVNVCRSLPHG